MNFVRTEIPEVVIVEPVVHGDSRGYFVETFKQHDLENFIGYQISFCQDNESKSDRGVLRGLHFQNSPHAQTKLVRVIQGCVLDVAVDIRVGSATYGKFVSVELTGENKKQLLVPRGFAHGFVALEDNTIFSYKVDNYYNKESEGGVIFNDSGLAIDWGIDSSNLNLADKDLVLPSFSDFKSPFSVDVDYYGG